MHQQIIERACRAWNVREADLLGWIKKRPIARKRQVLAWKLYQLPYMSYPAVGRLLCRDHTTIMHAVKTVNALIDAQDSMILGLIQKLDDYEGPPERLVGPDFLMVISKERTSTPKERPGIPPLDRSITPREYVRRAA